MFVQLNVVEAQVAELIDQGRHEEALQQIVMAVQATYRLPALAHHMLYYPGLDRQMERLAQALAASGQPSLEAMDVGTNTLVVASELYAVGGHSRVLEDLVRELPSPTVVLTDLFHSYRQQPRHLDALHAQLDGVPLIALNHSSLWHKCQQLYRLVQRLRPRCILYLQHFQDAVAFVGTLGHGGPVKSLVHHCDHNPSLGCTVAGMGHVDVTDELGTICRQHLGHDTTVLPLYVPDQGCRTFDLFAGHGFSVVTAGTAIKFSRGGAVPLQGIVATALQAVDGRFFHIGPLPQDWETEIRNHLQQQGLDPARFIALGPVASLWQTLAELDAHVYLSSAPVVGARGTVEAQGCGYPELFFRHDDPQSLLAATSLHADTDLGWHTLAELGALLRSMDTARQQAASRRSRAYYEQRFSRRPFLRALPGLLGPGPAVLNVERPCTPAA
ncbi:hypothetical protein [Azohydromonas australica]|uniref:hypothetical protein n=1 Tax=Azohydromonas australica TaxID=364039 RepID=UPI0004160AE3|nr:hypothetical protein [Azohydromonas australica]